MWITLGYLSRFRYFLLNFFYFLDIMQVSCSELSSLPRPFKTNLLLTPRWPRCKHAKQDPTLSMASSMQFGRVARCWGSKSPRFTDPKSTFDKRNVTMMCVFLRGERGAACASRHCDALICLKRLRQIQRSAHLAACWTKSWLDRSCWFFGLIFLNHLLYLYLEHWRCAEGTIRARWQSASGTDWSSNKKASQTQVKTFTNRSFSGATGSAKLLMHNQSLSLIIHMVSFYWFWMILMRGCGFFCNLLQEQPDNPGKTGAMWSTHSSEDSSIGHV